ncbi:hypothetical protein SLEP1_g19925 [Rubroshorea leprosula]|uniref:Uncharacterized protein n=1 Tax=Rubroshorea leprosula TaxID=152421 RepID=A0AAV5JA50_9ROSI|nr:hypothetical protein SLEP1_g19925 [Rubroshorea leprosula]
MFLDSFEFKFLYMENCAKQIAMVKMFYQMGMIHPTLQEYQDILSLVSDTSSLDWFFYNYFTQHQYLEAVKKSCQGFLNSLTIWKPYLCQCLRHLDQWEAGKKLSW